jgi:hypothetical protein
MKSTTGEAEFGNADDNGRCLVTILYIDPSISIQEVENNSITISGEAGNLNVKYSANVPFDVNIDDPWLTERTGGGGIPQPNTLRFAYTENTGNTDRTTRIVLSQKDNPVVNAILYVTQTVTLPKRDSLALAALYDATNGGSWTNNTGWKTLPISQWYGVTVNNKGMVTKVDLSSNALSGNIPNDIVKLTELTELILNDNQLTGPIPADIENLAKLTKLMLFNNQLSGVVPQFIIDKVTADPANFVICPQNGTVFDNYTCI